MKDSEKSKDKSKKSKHKSEGGKLYALVASRIKSENRNNLEEKFLGLYESDAYKVFDVLEKDYGVTINNLLGMGTSAIAFKLNSTEIIKVCSKRIKYFNEFGTKSAHDFQKHMQPLQPYILPMKKIVYDGPMFFAYTQEMCRPLKKGTTISAKDFEDVLTIIQVLFKNGLLVGQLKPKNVGYNKDNKIVLFDYHSMHNLKARIDDKHSDWCHSLVGSLSTYCCLIYASNLSSHSKDPKNAMKKKTIRSIAEKHGSKVVPEPLSEFIRHIKGMTSSDKDLNKLADLLERSKVYIRQKYGNSSEVESSGNHPLDKPPKDEVVEKKMKEIDENKRKETNESKRKEPAETKKKEENEKKLKETDDKIIKQVNENKRKEDEDKKRKEADEKRKKEATEKKRREENENNKNLLSFDHPVALKMNNDQTLHKLIKTEELSEELVGVNIYMTKEDFKNLKVKYNI